jgi:hypothetical protein
MDVEKGGKRSREAAAATSKRSVETTGNNAGALIMFRAEAAAAEAERERRGCCITPT